MIFSPHVLVVVVSPTYMGLSFVIVVVFVTVNDMKYPTECECFFCLCVVDSNYK